MCEKCIFFSSTIISGSIQFRIHKKHILKMKQSAIYLFVIIFFYCHSNYAQSYTYGNHPSMVKWKYIEKDKIKIIFPYSTLEQAKRITDIITYINKEKYISVGDKSYKLDLLLNTNNSVANGYVALAPFRSVFYGTGLQNYQVLGTTNWLDNLSTHEYRHALQFSNTRHGFTNFAYYIGGESAWNLLNTLSIPAWYWEGDAVNFETLLSENGRGRLPSFFEKQRALFFSNKNYNYMQMRNGSYKNLIPNHYEMGYNMINYGRNHYDKQIWAKVLTGASSFSSIIYPFSGALKKETGLSTRDFYKACYKELKEKWTDELASTILTQTTEVTQKSKNMVTNYTYPKTLSDGSVICIKDSYDDTSKLVQIKNGREKVLTVIGVGTEPYLEINGNHVCWTEIRNDWRRQEKIYSVIVSYNLKTSKKRVITKESKYFSPMFSHNGEKILTVCADKNLENNIKILDAKTGVVLITIPNPENDFISYPKWIENESAIVYIAKRNSKLSILKYDLNRSTTTELMPWTSHSIGVFKVINNEIYFPASFSGINNIYCLKNDGSKEIKAITSVVVGADTPEISADGKVLYMSEQTEMGKQLTQIDIAKGVSKLSSNPITIIEPIYMKRFDIKTNEIEKPILNDIPINEYEIKDYKGLFRGMKLHSWGLTFDNNDSFAIGVSMDNILNDFSINASTRYNGNEQRMSYNASVTFAKYFLPVTASIESTDRVNTYNINNPNSSYITKKVNFDEISKNIGFIVPLSWLHSSYLTSFQLAPTFSAIETKNYTSNLIGFSPQNLDFNSAHVNLSFSNTRMKAIQNLNAKWSQSVIVDYFKSLDNTVSCEKISTIVNLSVAGISKNHGLDFSFRYKKELMANDYLYVDDFIHARGYKPLNNDTETVYSANYRFPICYPDLGFGGILYLKRIHGNLFYDSGMTESLNTKIKQNSTGAEMIFTLSPLNLDADLGIGIRDSFLLNTDPLNPKAKSNFEVFFSMKF
jgi:hypothetical protein